VEVEGSWEKSFRTSESRDRLVDGLQEQSEKDTPRVERVATPAIQMQRCNMLRNHVQRELAVTCLSLDYIS
jgi:hypothetical protein